MNSNLFMEFQTPLLLGTSSPCMCTTAKGVPPHIVSRNLRAVPRNVATVLGLKEKNVSVTVQAVQCCDVRYSTVHCSTVFQVGNSFCS